MKQFLKRKIGLTTALLSLVVLLSGCGSQAVENQGQTAVKTAVVIRQEVVGQVSVTGVLDAQDKSVLSAQLPGKVNFVGVKEGDQVKKGEVVVTLDQSDLQVQLQQAKANLDRSQAALDQTKISYDNAQADVLRYQTLYQTGAVSLNQLQQITERRDLALSQYQAAQGSGISTAQQSMQAIQLNLDKMTIRSPLDGIVATCSVSIGDNLVPGAPLVSVVATGNLVLTGNVSENVVNYLKQGQDASVTSDGISNKTFNGKVDYISPVSIPTGQFFPIKVTAQNTEGLLKAGMTGNANIAVVVPNQLTLPNEAVLQRSGQEVVFVIKDGKAVKTAVKTGLRNDKVTVITQGLTEGDKVVVSGVENLIEGMAVQIPTQ
ncbi:MAG: efflux RND transporter periplasmic adaptor subunit [Desulfitobacteriaceae bacterium]